jgi:hypothetical protein
MYLAILAGPCVAGVLMTGVVDGMPGLHEFFARLRRWRVGWTWYAIALLPAIAVTGAGLHSLTMPSIPLRQTCGTLTC